MNIVHVFSYVPWGPDIDSREIIFSLGVRSMESIPRSHYLFKVSVTCVIKINGGLELTGKRERWGV